MREGTLGHYQLEGELGSGGMGVVYRATDTRLGRSVAIKMLHDSFVRDTERMARLEREARVLASLNHANIATMYTRAPEACTPCLSMREGWQRLETHRRSSTVS